MNESLWIVGAGAGSIGETVREYAEHDRRYDSVIGTNHKEDVRDWGTISDFAFEHGPFTQVVYAAGIEAVSFLGGITSAFASNVFGVNVSGFFSVMRALLSNQPDGGRVVVLISDAARTPMRGSALYCSSKAALEMAVRCAARELAPKWQIIGVSPTIVDGTPMTARVEEKVSLVRGWTKEEALAYEAASQPIGRRCSKEEVAETILFALNGPEYLSGSIIMMQGGK